jgi:hypothetical protein
VIRDDNNNNNNNNNKSITAHSMFCGVKATLDVGPEVSIHCIASNM